MAGLLVAKDIKVVNSIPEIKGMVEDLNKSPIFAFDLETDGPDKKTRLNPYTSVLGSFQFCTKNNDYYVPLSPRGGKIGTKTVIETIGCVFQDPEKTMLGHNIKFDCKHLMVGALKENLVVSVRNKFIDTLNCDWILNENERRHNLEVCAKRELGIDMIKFDDGEAGGDLSDIRICYGGDDVRVPWKLWFDVYKDRIEAEGLTKVFHKLQMRYINVIMEMELTGMKIDIPEMETAERDYEAKSEGLKDEIHELAGQNFLISSPAQVSRVLFDEMGFKPESGVKKTKTGNWPTGRAILEAYVGEHLIFEKILEFKKGTKMLTGFIRPLKDRAEAFDGRIRSNFNQAFTVSGRLSSSDPNLQNIPSGNSLIRDAFIAEDGNVVVMADFSQLELRIMAHLSKDPTLLKAFNEGLDIHQITADECGCSRSSAKVVNFGIIYGMTAMTLGKGIGVAEEEAQEYQDAYFRRYKGVKDYQGVVWRTLDQRGYVKTITGRRRRFPEWGTITSNREMWKKNRMHRQAVNSSIQGSAADLIMLSQRNVLERFRREGVNAWMISQVHDEMIMETSKANGDYVLKVVIEEMEKCVKLRIPLIADGFFSTSWGGTKRGG